MAISERLYKLRKDKNISQEELANELGVSRQTISKWETGESTPDFDKIVPLCEYFGITSDELLSGKKDIVAAKAEDVKAKFARNIAISVAVYILSIVMIILFSTLVDQPIIGVCLFFILIAIATGVIIYSSIVYSKEKEKVITKKEEKKNNTVKQICNIVDLLGLVVYFIVSFGTGAWYITWVIFLIIGLCEAIVKLIFNIKDDDCENCCEKDKCEKDE